MPLLGDVHYDRPPIDTFHSEFRRLHKSDGYFDSYRREFESFSSMWGADGRSAALVADYNRPDVERVEKLLSEHRDARYTVFCTHGAASDVSANQPIEVDIAVGDMNPGVNELAWHLNSTDAGSGVTFDYHWLKMKPSPDGMAIIVR